MNPDYLLSLSVLRRVAATSFIAEGKQRDEQDALDEPNCKGLDSKPHRIDLRHG
jgi:hypothetical protein